MTVCLDTGVFLQIFVVTEDGHFGALNSAGYKPKTLAPGEFIRRHLPVGS